MQLSVRPVTPERWPDLAGFFGPSGAYSNCWCTYFRQTGKEFSAGCRDNGTGNRELLERLTSNNRVPGLLAYPGTDTAPVGWVSLAPREEFTRVMRSPILRPELRAEAAVWSVVCFWMPRQNRGKGIATQLLSAAVGYAGEHGASVVEGYPVDTRGRRQPSASLYTGTVSLFSNCGFAEAYRRSESRPVMRRQLR